LTAPTIEARLRGQKPGPSKPLAKSVNDAGSSTDGGRYWRRDQLTFTDEIEMKRDGFGCPSWTIIELGASYQALGFG